ncbi:Uncharacterised protein [Klebsiella pneumoniae subsp. ozaenae]|uniref:Uncharacterized protein n=1 Tax=Klebsiella pneumoniae subsp. ozaenae TaxID=574 RepID=A0A378AG34_KLEPO|nr:Uncharacterised protein [Klebsiella pneumoniae subsp. ozaenae]
MAASTDSVPLLQKKLYFSFPGVKACQGFRQHRPQRVQQLLTVKRLFRELILDGGYHNWITVPYIEDAKPTKAVDKLLSLGVDKRI